MSRAQSVAQYRFNLLIFVCLLSCSSISSENISQKRGRSTGLVGQWWRRAASSLSPSHSARDDKYHHYHSHNEHDNEDDYSNPDSSSSDHSSRDFASSSGGSRFNDWRSSPSQAADSSHLQVSESYPSADQEIYPAKYPVDRFDYYRGEYKGDASMDDHHHKVMEHHMDKEVKEISYVYPVLIALLILGALFVPFMSLFFFLSVSAFNCQSGFSQVTPLFGRRRRRRRKRELTMEDNGGSSASGLNGLNLELDSDLESDSGSSRRNSTLFGRLNERESDFINARNRQRRLSMRRRRTNKTLDLATDLDFLSSQLPLVMLFDSSHDMLWSPASESRGQSGTMEEKALSSGRNETITMLDRDLKQLQVRLATSTLMLWDAISQFGSDFLL